jgi:hypothetical protein
MNAKAQIVVILSCFLAPAFAAKNAYWQCIATDAENKQWSVNNNYQKVAFHLAFAACKKESLSPTSCKMSAYDCLGFNQYNSSSLKWQCTAFDQATEYWRSNFYSKPEDAALAAKAFCKSKSSLPETCYINLVTCITNKNTLVYP